MIKIFDSLKFCYNFSLVFTLYSVLSIFLAMEWHPPFSSSYCLTDKISLCYLSGAVITDMVHELCVESVNCSAIKFFDYLLRRINN